MIITLIERAQLNAVRDDILIAINSDPFAVNIAQIGANNLFALIDQSIEAPMTGIPVAAVQKIVDELTALIKGEVPQTPNPSTATTLIEGGGGSLVNAGHTWTFGEHVDGRGAKILRDGVQYASGVAHKLVLADGAVWAEAAAGTWYKDSGTGWIGGGSGPTIAPTSPTNPTVTPGTASPEGTSITAGSGQSIIDSAGHVWTFGSLLLGNSHNPGPDYAILMDGSPLSYGGGAKSLMIKGDVIFATSDNRWGRLVYKNTGTSWQLIEGTQ